MMSARQIVLDTETTGLDPQQGHRIIEIAAVEINNRRFTGRNFHRYLNPEREIDQAASEVHGLTWDNLRDKPKFNEIAAELIDFVRDAELVIHNAGFDEAFLDSELNRIAQPKLRMFCGEIIDSLKLAKELHPGKRNNLDALCERYQIDNSKRTLHGAMLDAELLAEVYLAMTRGQETLLIDMTPSQEQRASLVVTGIILRVIPATASELAEHHAYLQELQQSSKGLCLWQQLLQHTEASSISL